MLFRNIGNQLGVYRAVNATVAGTSEIDGAAYDLQGSFGGPFAGIYYECCLGTATDTTVTSIKIQGSADGSTNWTDIAGTHQTCNPTGDSNKILATDCFRPQFQWVRPVITRATANCVVDSVVGHAYLARSTPITTQDATVSTASSSGGSTLPAPVNIVAYGAGGTA